MRRLIRFDVSERPATFATAHERRWREAVTDALRVALGAPDFIAARTGARFMLRVEFRTPVPASKNEAWDLDNLIKPTMDALGDVLGYRSWNGPEQAADDTVDHIDATKRTVRAGEQPGATIEVWADALQPHPDNAPTDREQTTAFHEAGHVVVGHNMGLILEEADIEGGDDYAGAALFKHHDDPDTGLPMYTTRAGLETSSLDYVEAVMAMSWAGVLAQEMAGYGGEDADGGFGLVATGAQSIIASGSDLDHLAHLAGEFGGSPDIPPVLLELMRLTSEAVLSRCWAEVEAVAAALIEHRRLPGDGLAEVITGVHEAEQAAWLARVRQSGDT